MTKIYVPLPKKKYTDFYLEQNIDGFFLGIEKFSINFNSYVKEEDLKDTIDYIKNNNKEVYISFNKLFLQKDVDKITKLLLKINELNVDGVIFCDAAIYEIVKENGLNINLIIDSYHVINNYKTFDFWLKKGVKKGILSTEITINEMIEINNKSDMKFGSYLYGYLNMVTSSRSLISNYFKHKKMTENNNKLLMEVNDEKYPIVEENDETNIFSSKVLNGIKYFPELIENNIDFIILNDYLLDPIKFYNVIEAFTAIRRNHADKEFLNKLDEVVKLNTEYDTYDAFLNKKTIYKVK